MRRRDLLTMAGATGAFGLAAGSHQAAGATISKKGVRLFDVREFGAAGDGKTLDSRAINAAIDACNASGGGVAYVPPGEYRCGTIVLKSRVTLYLEAGATILGSQDLADYTSQTVEPAEVDITVRHLIFARDADNTGLAGPGASTGKALSSGCRAAGLFRRRKRVGGMLPYSTGIRWSALRPCWSSLDASISASKTCASKTLPDGPCAWRIATTL